MKQDHLKDILKVYSASEWTFKFLFSPLFHIIYIGMVGELVDLYKTDS